MELIKITTNEQGFQVVSARDLYESLGLNQAVFARWAKKNITSNTFAILGSDYTMLNIMLSNGNIVPDFAITIDFAKRLAMMARTEEGESVRNYFIECEKKLQNKALPTDFIESLEMLLESKKKEKQLAFELEIKTQDLAIANEVIKEQAPSVAFVEKVLQSKTTMTTTQIAKELDMTADKLYSILRNKGVVFKQSGNYMLYGKYQGKGYAETRTHQYYGSTGESRTNTYLVWTESGRKFIHEQLNSNLNYAVVQTQTTAQWQG